MFLAGGLPLPDWLPDGTESPYALHRQGDGLQRYKHGTMFREENRAVSDDWSWSKAEPVNGGES